MLGVVLELIEADRTESWQMHLQAVSDCLLTFAATSPKLPEVSLPLSPKDDCIRDWTP